MNGASTLPIMIVTCQVLAISQPGAIVEAKHKGI